MDKNDIMLKQFFNENKREIDDFGFSRRVQQKLPDLQDRSWIVWAFAAIGTALCLWALFHSDIPVRIMGLLRNVPYYYVMAGFMVLMLVPLLLLMVPSRFRTSIFSSF